MLTDQSATILGSLYQFTRSAIILAVMLTIIWIFAASVTSVHGTSMWPTLEDDQKVVVDKVYYYWNRPTLGDVVVLRFPGDPEQTSYVKRIIGLPGQTVQVTKDQVLIDGKPLHEPYLGRQQPGSTIAGRWQLGFDQYFLLGDNRVASNDSRHFGPVEERFIIGKAQLVLWPIMQTKLVE